jgi:dTDP-4-amino-4,6-dideoxygalactose transaminase
LALIRTVTEIGIASVRSHLCRIPPSLMTKPARVYLSSPHLGSSEFDFVREAFATNWIAPLGPHVDGFERELCGRVGSRHAAALSSGTAALHLALKLVGVKPGDEVFCSTLTFSASANPIVYEGGRPVFLDSERASWNLDPAVLEAALADRARKGRLPRALIVVHLYGQCADLAPIVELCERHGMALIEDAAEALGARFTTGPLSGRSPGAIGQLGIFSFNGNKIITTSGGGMLVSDDEAMIAKARFWATQARDPAPHYQHSEIGYNYRMSNVLAGIGRGQLRVLEARVNARRANCAFYQQAFADLPGITFMPEAPWNRSNRWLTCIQVDPQAFGADREAIRLALECENIEARPVWKPMHLQPVFAHCDRFGGDVAEDLFNRGLCLPSGSNLTEEDLQRVVDVVRRSAKR